MPNRFRIAIVIIAALCMLSAVSCSKKADAPSSAQSQIKAKQIEPLIVTGPAPESMIKRAQVKANESKPKQSKSPEEKAKAKEERLKKRAEKKAAKAGTNTKAENVKEEESSMAPDQPAPDPAPEPENKTTTETSLGAEGQPQ